MVAFGLLSGILQVFDMKNKVCTFMKDAHRDKVI